MRNETDLQRRQREHLEAVHNRFGGPGGDGSDCLHNGCSECIGTGVRRDGSACIHAISCPCPRCTPRC